MSGSQCRELNLQLTVFFFSLKKFQGVMVGFKDKLLFSHNKKELTKDLPYFDKVKVRYFCCTSQPIGSASYY